MTNTARPKVLPPGTLVRMLDGTGLALAYHNPKEPGTYLIAQRGREDVGMRLGLHFVVAEQDEVN